MTDDPINNLNAEISTRVYLTLAPGEPQFPCRFDGPVICLYIGISNELVLVASACEGRVGHLGNALRWCIPPKRGHANGERVLRLHSAELDRGRDILRIPVTVRVVSPEPK